MTKTEKKLQLKALKREVFGKNLRKLRKEGSIPANIYGPAFQSLSITMDGKDFSKVYRVAQETGVVYIHAEKQELPVLIKNVQWHPVFHTVLHVDFRKIDLKQKIETQVPVRVVGESPAVKQKGGVLLTQLNEIMVEALPQDIPHEIEVDIAGLDEIGKEIKIADLPKNSTYTIKNEVDKVVISVIAHKEESLTPETTAAAPEVLTEKPVEGEEAAEGAEPTEVKEGKETKEEKKAEKKEEKSAEKAAEGKPSSPKASEGKDSKKEEKK